MTLEQGKTVHAAVRRAIANTGTLLSVAFGSAFIPTSSVAVPPTQINVEIDWMQNANHSHRPSNEEMAAIQQMFGCHGITLNLLIDEAIPHVDIIPDSTAVPDTVRNFFTWVGTNSFASMKNQFFDNAGGGWHYCIFAHTYDPEGTGTVSCSSGLGEMGGDDFIVTLGCAAGQVGTAFDRAATYAHELGHNLGLDHAAGGDTVAGVFSPNYASIMSYQYQLDGVRNKMKCLDLVDTLTANQLLKEIDYSNGRFPSINENSLSETRGVGIRSVDWNCNGTIGSPVAQDLDADDNWCASSGPRTVLADQNDWALIVDNTFARALPPSRYESCVTADIEERMLRAPGSCSPTQPTQLLDACVNGAMIWVNATHVGNEVGTGDEPFNTLMEAYNAAPLGSALFLQPTGTYNTGGSVVLNKPLRIAGPGVVTVVP